MPPHQFLGYALFQQFFQRKLSLGLLTAAVILTGCASTGSQQTSMLIDSDFAELDANFDSQYDFSIESDPLAALLAKRHTSDIAIFQGQSRRGQKQNFSTPNDSVEAMGFANTALSFLGVKYRMGGTTPTTGFDCSGLVSYAAEKSLGLKLPRTSADLAKAGESIKQTELQKGDLVFFNTLGRRFSHVGIYLGEGKFVHSPRTGSVVRVESMHTNYWKKRYNGARRLAANTPESTVDSPRLRSAK